MGDATFFRYFINIYFRKITFLFRRMYAACGARPAVTISPGGSRDCVPIETVRYAAFELVEFDAFPLHTLARARASNDLTRNREIIKELTGAVPGAAGTSRFVVT